MPRARWLAACLWLAAKLRACSRLPAYCSPRPPSCLCARLPTCPPPHLTTCLRSWYMLMFQSPRVGEAYLRHDGGWVGGAPGQ
jgi:hypothetical protein